MQTMKERFYVVRCAVGGGVGDLYGPFVSDDDAIDFLLPHRDECPATEQAWLDDNDEADEAHDIVEVMQP
jgi:hypothetical protein